MQPFFQIQTSHNKTKGKERYQHKPFAFFDNFFRHKSLPLYNDAFFTIIFDISCLPRVSKISKYNRILYLRYLC